MRLSVDLVVIPDNLEATLRRDRLPVLLRPLTPTWGQCLNCGGFGALIVDHVIEDERVPLQVGDGAAVAIAEGSEPYKMRYGGELVTAVRESYACPMCSADAPTRLAAYRVLSGADVGPIEPGSDIDKLVESPRPVGYLDGPRPRGATLRTLAAVLGARGISARYDTVGAIVDRIRRCPRDARAGLLARFERLGALVLERDVEPTADDVGAMLFGMLAARRRAAVTLTVIARPDREAREDQN